MASLRLLAALATVALGLLSPCAIAEKEPETPLPESGDYERLQELHSDHRRRQEKPTHEAVTLARRVVWDYLDTNRPWGRPGDWHAIDTLDEAGEFDKFLEEVGEAINRAPQRELYLQRKLLVLHQKLASADKKATLAVARRILDLDPTDNNTATELFSTACQADDFELILRCLPTLWHAAPGDCLWRFRDSLSAIPQRELNRLVGFVTSLDLAEWKSERGSEAIQSIHECLARERPDLLPDLHRWLLRDPPPEIEEVCRELIADLRDHPEIAVPFLRTLLYGPLDKGVTGAREPRAADAGPPRLRLLTHQFAREIERLGLLEAMVADESTAIEKLPPYARIPRFVLEFRARPTVGTVERLFPHVPADLLDKLQGMLLDPGHEWLFDDLPPGNEGLAVFLFLRLASPAPAFATCDAALEAAFLANRADYARAAWRILLARFEARPSQENTGRLASVVRAIAALGTDEEWNRFRAELPTIAPETFLQSALGPLREAIMQCADHGRRDRAIEAWQLMLPATLSKGDLFYQRLEWAELGLYLGRPRGFDELARLIEESLAAAPEKHVPFPEILEWMRRGTGTPPAARLPHEESGDERKAFRSVDLKSVRETMDERYPNLRTELHTRDGPAPDKEVLNVGPFRNNEIATIGIPWNPGDTFTLSAWTRSHTRHGIAYLDFMPITKSAQYAPGHDTAGRRHHPLSWDHLRVEATEFPPDTTAIELRIHARWLHSDSPCWIDVSDLRIARTRAAQAPAEAKLLARVPGHPSAMALIPGTPRVALAFKDSRLVVFDTDRGEIVAQRTVNGRQFVRLEAIGTAVFGIDTDSTFWRFDIATKRLTRLAENVAGSMALAVSPDGEFVAYHLRDGQGEYSLRLCAMANDTLRELPSERLDFGRALAFEPGALRILADPYPVPHLFKPNPHLDNNLNPALKPKQRRFDLKSMLTSEEADYDRRSFPSVIFEPERRFYPNILGQGGGTTPSNWNDLQRGTTYRVVGNELQLMSGSQVAKAVTFPAPLATMAIRLADGELVIADRYGQLWNHPPVIPPE